MKSDDSMKLFSSLPLFPVRLHMRTDLHLARKVWHLVMGLSIVGVYLAGMSRGTSIMFLGSALGIDVLVEAARLRNPALNEKILRMWGPFMRSCEVDRFSGTPYYISAAILAIAIFPKPIAVLSILYLACGDPIASLFGVLHGHRSIRFKNGKSLVGTVAGIVTCFITTLIFLKAMDLPSSVVWVMSLSGGLAGGLAEHIPWDIDDNFTIPIFSGFILWLAFILMGI